MNTTEQQTSGEPGHLDPAPDRDASSGRTDVVTLNPARAPDTSAAPAEDGSTGAVRPDEFPTRLDAPMQSSVRKAQVRAALFRKLEPVRIGRFVLLERLGAGNMGEIYAAYDEQLDRRLALKLIRQGTDEVAKADQLLQREAKALAKVSHPNVVQVYEAGAHDGRLFIAMELIRGQTLTEWLEDMARLPARRRRREVLRQFIAAGRGLEAAHAVGVAHRDFKPDNVLVGDDGRVRVVDFGLARALGDQSSGEPVPGEPVASAPATTTAGRSAWRLARFATAATIAVGPDREASWVGRTEPVRSAEQPAHEQPTAATQLTEPGMWMGTPQFMAPEQLRREVADHRSDQFSFCVALYHALYGVFPFSVKGAGKLLDTRGVEKLLDSMRDGAANLEHSAGVAGLAGGVRKVLSRGLAFEPSHRFASMGELIAALEPELRRGGRRLAGAVLVFCLGAAAGARCLIPPAAEPCAAAGDSIRRAWTSAHQTAVATALQDSDLPYAGAVWRTTRQRLDDYARRWSGEAEAACRASHVDHTQSDAQLDLRMACLERAGRRFGALVTELGKPGPEAVQGAVEASEALPDLHACSHGDNLLFGLAPPPAVIAGAVDAVRQDLARAFALERLGRFEPALAIARAARDTAAARDYPAVRAEALVEMARARDGDTTPDARADAETWYLEALDLAEAARHDQLAVEIWSRLALLAIRMDSGVDQALARWRRADAAVRRIGDGDHDRARLHDLRSRIYYRASDFASAEAEARQAIARIAGVPEQQLEDSRYRSALASALAAQGQLADAIAEHERALALASAAVDTAHPAAVRISINLGNALMKHGQRARARGVLEAAWHGLPAGYRASHVDGARLQSSLSELGRAEGKLDAAWQHAETSLAIYQRANARDTDQAEAHFALASVEVDRGDFGAALGNYRRAAELRRPHASSADYQLARTEGGLAEALVGLGRHHEALQHVEQAEQIFAASSGRHRATLAWIRRVHGEALLGLGRREAAVAVLEPALQLCSATPEPSTCAMVAWTLARGLHALGRAPARVRELASNADQLLSTLGELGARKRGELREFLQRLQ